MRTLRPVLASLIPALLLIGVSLSDRSAAGCPFCSAPSLTLSEQLAQSDAAALVQWVSGESASADDPGTTTYAVVEILREPKAPLKKGDRITLNRFRAGQKGDLFLLMGTLGATSVDWGSPLEVTEASYQYVAQAPSPEAAPEARLEYFGKFLEYPDQMVANDAYAEFANAPYDDIVPVARKMDRERIRKWLASPDTPVTRLALYGLLLGQCGNESDANLMEQKILEQTDDFRLGIEGIMSGYLVLTGDKGLQVLERTKLADKDVPFSETYAAMQALRFMWQYGNGEISQDRMREAMRILLDRPELADLVIADLARWKDWSVQDRLMELYGAEEYDIPSIKRAIVRYMLVSTKDIPAGGGEATPAHVVNGQKHLAELEEKDPKTVSEAKRFFFLK